MIAIYYNDIELDLPSDEMTPLTKQVNDVAQLDAFKSDFVREFKVNRTRAMEALFENASLVNSQTTLPYEALDVKVEFLGLEAVPKGKMAINKVDENYYYCAIYSGAKNVFDVLRELKLNSLDLDTVDSPLLSLEHEWSGENARDSILYDLDYQYLLCDTSDDGQMIADADPLVFAVATLRPCVRVSYLFEKIFENYTLVNAVEENELFLKMFVPISTVKTTKDAVTDYLVICYSQQPSVVPGKAIHIDEVVFDPVGLINTNAAGSYVARVSGNHYFKILFPLLFTTITDVEAKVSGLQIATSYDYSITEGFFIEADLTIGDEVTFFAIGDNIPVNTYINFRCFSIEPQIIGVTSIVDPAYYLPSIKQSDFVKAICNIFGLVPDYDPLTKTVTLWNINDIYTNKPIAKDWSDYLSIDDEQLTFRLDYARLNNLKWKANEDVSQGNGDAFIAAIDKNLTKEKTLFELPFSFSDEVTHQSEPMARIGWYETIPDSTEYKARDSVSPRLVTREAMSIAAQITDGSTYSLTNSQAYAARSFPLDLNVSVAYNDAIVRMLRNTKVLTLKFNLPVQIVVDLDHSIPIYLQQYSDYFFVKKVSNYMPNRICTVELIRLT